MMMRIRALAIIASFMLLAACDGDPDEADAGVDSGVMGSDGGNDAGNDAGPGTDAGTDAGPPPCMPACAADEACVRDVCVASCGADTSGWDAALAADLVPIATFCRSAAAFGTHISGGVTDVFDFTTATSSSGTSFTLSTWVADPTTAPTPSVVGMANAIHASDVSLFAGGYVAASPNGASVAFGYTLGDATFSGEIFEIVTAGGTSTAIDATGNFDATWLSDDVVLVNGLGIEGTTESGQALYAVDVSGTLATRQVVTGIGSASGSVEITGDSVLLGGFDDSFVGHVYVALLTEVEAAAGGGTAIVLDASDELLYDGGPVSSAFERVGDLFVTSRYDDSFALEALQAQAIEPGPALGAPSDLTTGDTFTAAYEAAGDRILLRYAEGLLLVE